MNSHPSAGAARRSPLLNLLCGLAVLLGSLLALPAAPAALAAPRTIFVRPAATGAGDGSSWADAFATLPPALAAAVPGDVLWVAGGTYTPTDGAERSASFALKPGVALYGGFAGDETSPGQRRPALTPSVLSGNIGDPATADDNSYQVVTAAAELTATALLDGFTIVGGSADALTETLRVGGGLLVDGSPTLRNLLVTGNRAALGGGGIQIAGSPALVNVAVAGNSGGGVAVAGGAPALVNVTLAGNTGAGLSVTGGAPSVRNSVVWGNTLAVVNSAGNAPTFSASLVEGSGGSAAWNTLYGQDGGRNLDADPRFVALPGDLRLQPGSPAIDAGDNGLVPPDVTLDLGGRARFVDVPGAPDTGAGVAPLVDMGAYEARPAIFAMPAAVGLGDGSSWADAATLPAALAAALPGDEIWAAAGVYTPTTSLADPRAATFALPAGVTLRGGFAGTERWLWERDWARNRTLLSGEIGSAGAADNSYHVVTLAGENAALDGLTIADGNADGGGPGEDVGGGLYASGGSLELTNVLFVANAAARGAGLAAADSSLALANVLFSSNQAQSDGGALLLTDGADAALAHVTSAGNSGGADIVSEASDLSVANSIVWSAGAAVAFSGTPPTLASSIVAGGCPAGATCTGVLDADPRFVDADGPDDVAGTLDDDLRLRGESPAIDAADSAAVPPALDTDLSGDDRRVDFPGVGSGGAQPDMGAYEARPVLYATPAGAGLGDGSSWANATTLRQALGTPPAAGYEIWVAQGIHLPSDTADSSDSFRLAPGVGVYGGFAGDELRRDQRAWWRYPTILSGDLDGDDNDPDGDGIVASWADIVGTNSSHVVVALSGVDSTATLDGFVVTAGSGPQDGGGLLLDEGEPTLRNLDVVGNQATRGGGAFVVDSDALLEGITFRSNQATLGGGLAVLGGAPELRHLTVRDNESSYYGAGLALMQSSAAVRDTELRGNVVADAGGGVWVGGGSPSFERVSVLGNQAPNGAGLYLDSTSPTLTTMLISGNAADDRGGAIWALGSSSPGVTTPYTLTNVTISGNTAGTAGAALVSESATPIVRNSIIWGHAGTSPISSTLGFTPTIASSLIEGGCPAGATCSGLVTADPQFVEPVPAAPSAEGNLRLRRTSPAIDVGDNALIPPGVDRDLDHRPRLVEVPGVGADTTPPAVDLGAYESRVVLFVDDDVVGENNGSSWADAYTSLRHALDVAYSGQEVWVAAGVYLPTTLVLTSPTTYERGLSFDLPDGVAVYGGFAGSETQLAQRDLAAGYVSLLSGDIDANDGGGPQPRDDSNSFHVVSAIGVGPAAVLDGFTIRAGNADGLGADGDGGGMIVLAASPTLRNLTIAGNAATDGGGVYVRSSDSNPSLTNVVISGNVAGVGGGLAVASGSATLLHATIAGNTGSLTGGIAAGGSGSATLRNSIVWGNAGGQITGNATVTSSIVQGGFAGGGNSASDPLLASMPASAPSAEGDLRLLPGSAAIDAGDPASCAPADIRGVARPNGAGCDVGAYESRGFTLAIAGGDSQRAPLGAPFPAPLSALVASPFGEPVAGGLVSFAVVPSLEGAAATLTAATAPIGPSGVASVGATANDVRGSYTARASAGSAVPASVSFRLRNGDYVVMLPLVMRAPMPDLVVERIEARGSSITLTIRNVGSAPASAAFWVDAYIAPDRAPTKVNETWPLLGSRGMVWGVVRPGVPLAPGAALTLTTGDGYYQGDLSRPGGTIAPGTPIYAQVDSANAPTTYGAVQESDEEPGMTYNNILGPTAATASGAAPARVTSPAAPAAADEALPARP